MKALSLWEPWASLMAEGYKRVETRGWSTDYRGDLIICSAKVRDVDGAMLWDRLQGEGAIPKSLGSFPGRPFGRAVAIVQVTDCVPTEWLLASHEDRASHLRSQYLGSGAALGELERDLGNYTDGRFAWLTTNLRPLRKLPYVKGRQKLFDVPDADVAGWAR